ncbi:MAG TPA: CRTAC1 family protein, partial [Pirellulales bacterium]|nr:CRTAC1 family protein [Pirellulales bacterium]
MTDVRSLVEVSQDSRLAELKELLAVVAADVYHDGDLDLIISTSQGVSIWSNRGDMTFDEITGRSQLPPAEIRATAIVPVDWDRDVDIDLLVAGPAGMAAGYLENLRHGQFRWRPFDKGFESLQSTAALALLDADGNGAWDLASVGNNGTTVIHTTINRAGLVDARTSTALAPSPRAGIATWDYDNDGHMDLVTWGLDGVDGFRGKSRGRFSSVTGLFNLAATSIRTCRVGDLDGDGDEDLAIVDANRLLLLANEGGNTNQWLNLEPRADTRDPQNVEGRTNHYALGSVIEIRTGATIQRQVVAKQRVHFGLGRRQTPDVARIIWTTGVPQTIVNPEPDQVIAELQILIGSCPYLYTWNGERFEFYTDCLWGAPIGLQLADGVLAPSRSWEYLRIDGDKLREHDGVYRLQITEELWEAAYFDQVQLIAVDHPADVEVYSNEKVGPAEIAQFKVHTVDRRRPPVAALDQHGRDVLDAVRHRDGNYLKCFDRKLAPGLAEQHFLQLDLGPWEKSRQAV